MNPDLPSAHDYALLGLALRSLRNRAGLKQAQAADKIGVRDAFLSQIEHGKRGMRWHTLLAILNTYDADLRQLADAIDEASAQP
jgi:transcriptional regulator with XRE-family HTH domain